MLTSAPVFVFSCYLISRPLSSWTDSFGGKSARLLRAFTAAVSRSFGSVPVLGQGLTVPYLTQIYGYRVLRVSHKNLVTKHWRIWHKCPNYKALPCLTKMSWLKIFCSKSHTNILITKLSDYNRSTAVSHTNALITLHCHISHFYPNYEEMRYFIQISWLQKHCHISHKCSDYKALPYLTCMLLTKALQ